MPPALAERLARLDWPALGEALAERGYVQTPRILSAAECRELERLWDEPERFRSHVDLARYRFGEGAYRYFRNPLPPLVETLRCEAYRHLVPFANRQQELLARAERFPPTLRGFLRRCHAEGQRRPTPLLLRYTRGGHNCLHQDLYGPVAFPFQLTAFLSRPGRDYLGGAFLLVEQRPRSQSLGDALWPGAGELVIFASAERAAPGRRGPVRHRMRHGVARVRRGRRTTLGVIFHDAR